MSGGADADPPAVFGSHRLSVRSIGARRVAAEVATRAVGAPREAARAERRLLGRARAPDLHTHLVANIGPVGVLALRPAEQTGLRSAEVAVAGVRRHPIDRRDGGCAAGQGDHQHERSHAPIVTTPHPARKMPQRAALQGGV